MMARVSRRVTFLLIPKSIFYDNKCVKKRAIKLQKTFLSSTLIFLLCSK